jgi:hypothetical protein
MVAVVVEDRQVVGVGANRWLLLLVEAPAVAAQVFVEEDTVAVCVAGKPRAEGVVVPVNAEVQPEAEGTTIDSVVVGIAAVHNLEKQQNMLPMVDYTHIRSFGSD